jgi:hypothetical protein
MADADLQAQEREWYSVSDIKTFLHDGYGRVLGQIDLTDEALFKASYYGAASIGTFMFLEQAKDALIKTFDNRG